MSDLEDFEELFRTVGIECDFIDLEKENYSRPDIFWESKWWETRRIVLLRRKNENY